MKKKEKEGFGSFISFTMHYRTDDKCLAHLKKVRWNNEAFCPHCTTDKPYQLSDGHWLKCRNSNCRKKFNVLTRTIFENTKIPLPIWFAGIYLFTSHKKGISSIQVGKDLGITQKSAWFMLQRLRSMMGNFEIELDGIVEMDEAYVGGKARNVKGLKGFQGRSTVNKTPIIGMVERGGRVITKVVKDVSGKTISDFVNAHIKPGATIVTDGWRSYRKISDNYVHLVNNHSKGSFVTGNVHTNTIEGFWSLMKRGIIGIYHNVSGKHMEMYCGEFEFRYNTRKYNETQRFNFVLTQAETRLKYKEFRAVTNSDWSL